MSSSAESEPETTSLYDALPHADGAATAGFERRARVMFFAALSFLVLLAVIIPHGSGTDFYSETLISSDFIFTVFFGLWILIIFEGIAGWLTAEDGRKKAARRLALVSLVPPFRMTVSPARPNDAVWLPKLGWIVVCRGAVAEMERRLAKPMIAVTVLIIPIIAADFLLLSRPHDTLESKLVEVSDVAISKRGMRLFLIDDQNRTLATFTRDASRAMEDVSDTWTIPNGEETPTELTLDTAAATVVLGTGCAITRGTVGAEGFTGIHRAESCAPTLLETSLYLVTSFIWFAFAAEFVLLVSLAEKKMDFCKRHWINIVIILLPLLAFLRSFQVFRFLRLMQSGKLVRAYRLRGLVTRTVQLAMVFNLGERFQSRKPQKYAAQLEEKIAEREEELDELRSKLEKTRQRC